MDREEAIYTLKNTAWLGTDKDREKTEQAVYMAIKSLSAEQKEEELANDIARQMATIIENEQDMRVILKNASADRPSGEWRCLLNKWYEEMGVDMHGCPNKQLAEIVLSKSLDELQLDFKMLQSVVERYD